MLTAMPSSEQSLSRAETLERIYNMRAHLLLTCSNEFVSPWHDVVDDIDRKLQQLAKLVQVERNGSPEVASFQQDAFSYGFKLGIGRQGPALLLARLLQTPGVMVSASQLALALDLSRSTILVYLTHLRHGLAEAGFPNIIQTMRTRGYLINVADAQRLINYLSGNATSGEAADTSTPELVN